MQLIRTCRRTLAILGCIDGLASYITALLRVFWHPVWTGRRGRSRLVPEVGLLVGQAVKRYVWRRVVSVEQQVVRGTTKAIVAALAATGWGMQINTADIERLNVTFCASWAPLVRRGLIMAHTEEMLTAGMWRVGCADNGCSLLARLRLAAPRGASRKWQERTPAMATSLTNHSWTMRKLIRAQVPLHP